MVRIGDGDFLNARVEEKFESCRRIKRRIGRNPKNESAYGIDLQRIRIGEMGGDQLVRIGNIGGEEEIEWGAALDLRQEVATGTVGDGKLCAGLFFVLRGELGEDKLKIGSGSDTERLGSQGKERKKDRAKEQASEQSWLHPTGPPEKADPTKARQASMHGGLGVRRGGS